MRNYTETSTAWESLVFRTGVTTAYLTSDVAAEFPDSLSASGLCSHDFQTPPAYTQGL
jgi:hypothetical protein